MRNYITIESTQGKFNSTLDFYYLHKMEESSGYEIYNNGGYLGFTPSSWKNQMGIFHMLKHSP